MMLDVSHLDLSDIRSVVLFGSQARGEADSHSDTDLCLFVNDMRFDRMVELKRVAAAQVSVCAESVGIYTAAVLDRMCKSGSLLLWHLRLEGVILYDAQDFAASVFQALAVFEEYESALATYETLWRDVRLALTKRRWLCEFDYHILHGVVRDCCILLCYVAGRPTFGRTSAFKMAVCLYSPFPLDETTFERLTSWHLTYLRNAANEVEVPDAAFAESAVSMVERVIGVCRERLLSKNRA